METKRPVNEGAERRLFDRVDTGSGFVELIDYMGGDAQIAEAARCSYGSGTKTVSDDAALIRTLVRNEHTSPLEMAELKFSLKMPIYVARQWIRHRTANLNEYSARYSVLEKEFHLPDPADLAPQSASNKQGRSGGYGAAEAGEILAEFATIHDLAYGAYERLIDEDGHALARESARALLPVSVMTRLFWKIDLHNLLRFLRLRCDPHAQLEIRRAADAIELDAPRGRAGHHHLERGACAERGGRARGAGRGAVEPSRRDLRPLVGAVNEHGPHVSQHAGHTSNPSDPASARTAGPPLRSWGTHAAFLADARVAPQREGSSSRSASICSHFSSSRL